MNLKYSIS